MPSRPSLSHDSRVRLSITDAPEQGLSDWSTIIFLFLLHTVIQLWSRIYTFSVSVFLFPQPQTDPTNRAQGRTPTRRHQPDSRYPETGRNIQRSTIKSITEIPTPGDLVMDYCTTGCHKIDCYCMQYVRQRVT